MAYVLSLAILAALAGCVVCTPVPHHPKTSSGFPAQVFCTLYTTAVGKRFQVNGKSEFLSVFSYTQVLPLRHATSRPQRRSHGSLAVFSFLKLINTAKKNPSFFFFFFAFFLRHPKA